MIATAGLVADARRELQTCAQPLVAGLVVMSQASSWRRDASGAAKCLL
jgi:hypothetical protein